MIFSKDKQHCKKTYLYLATPMIGVARVYDVICPCTPDHSSVQGALST
nr:MAG TPA: hypothetical protein [Caudoviricetes sp.]